MRLAAIVSVVLGVALGASVAFAQSRGNAPCPPGLAANVESGGFSRCGTGENQVLFQSIDGEGATVNFKVVNTGRRGANCQFDVVITKLVDVDGDPSTPPLPQSIFPPITLMPGQSTGVIGGTGILTIQIVNCTSVRGEQGCYWSFIW